MFYSRLYIFFLDTQKLRFYWKMTSCPIHILCILRSNIGNCIFLVRCWQTNTKWQLYDFLPLQIIHYFNDIRMRIFCVHWTFCSTNLFSRCHEFCLEDPLSIYLSVTQTFNCIYVVDEIWKLLKWVHQITMDLLPGGLGFNSYLRHFFQLS